MTLSQIFSKLNILNAEVTIFRNNTSWSDDDSRWGCVITINNDGTELKLKATAANGDESILKAFAKLETMTASPDIIKALNLPLLSAPQAVA
jgi:hypothetical protein